MFSGSTESTDRIISPVNQAVPAAGTWVLERRLWDDLTGVSDTDDSLAGEKVGFTQDTMFMLGRYLPISATRSNGSM